MRCRDDIVASHPGSERPIPSLAEGSTISIFNLSAKPCRAFAINQGPLMSLFFSD
jgi:hypothetical protein